MVLCAVPVIVFLSLGGVGPLTHVGTLTGPLDSPARLAVTSTEILITDPRRDAIVRFDLAGTYLGTWSEPAGPLGVAVHPDGRIFVSRRDAQVGVYDSALTLLRFLADGNPMVNFVKPTDLALDSTTGRVYVVDSGGDRIYGFNSDESLALMLGVRGSNAGQFKYPSAVAVDVAQARLLVADQDNFRVQVFTTSGLFLFKFGYRIKYLPGGSSEGWFPRSAGLAVDAQSNIYVTDGAMSTLRVFGPTGTELAKLLQYGAGPADLRTPGDVALDGTGRILVAGSNAGAVKIYSAAPKNLLRSAGERLAGTNVSAMDLWWSGRLRVAAAGLTGPPEAGLLPEDALRLTTYDPPHMLDDVICGRCHNIDAEPGGHVGLVEGQTNLCISCHTGASQALTTVFRSADAADPYGTNPVAADGRGISHAWGVPAVNALADSVGPTAGGEMARYLKDGDIKCATCHDQHNNEAGAPYLRVSNNGDALCKECHAPRNECLGERGTHPVGFAYPSGTGEFPDVSTNGLPPLQAGKVECLTCHGVHYADSGGANSGAGDGMLLRGPNEGTFCQTCHTEHAIHGVRGPWQPTCTDCHDIHDPPNANLSLVAREVHGTPMTFQDHDLGSNGVSDFIHSNHTPASYSGICEVCHSSTAHHRNSAQGDHAHFTDMLCTDCHTHAAGFLPAAGSCTACHGQPPDGTAFPNTAGAHAAHMGGIHGPGITDCFVCHAGLAGATHLNGAASFASGLDADGDGNIGLAETDVCDICHSPDGGYDGVNDPVFGARPNWAGGVYEGGTPAAGKEQWCASCHDLGTSTIQGVNAPPVAGDAATWGYYTSGHGRSGMVTCTDCHDTDTPHIDGNARTYEVSPGGVLNPYNQSYRLKIGLEVPRPSTWVQGPEVAGYALCFSCHEANALLGDPLLDPTNAFYRSTWATNFRHDPPGYGSWGHGGRGQAKPGTATNTSIAFWWWQEDTGRGSPGSERAYLLPDITKPEFIYQVLDPSAWEPWFFQQPVQLVPGSTLLTDNPALWNGGQTSYAFGLPNSHYVHLSNIGSWWDWDSDWDGEFEENGFESTRSCPTCHNVHGSSFPAMIRDGQLVGKTGLQFGIDPGAPDEGSYVVPYGSGTCLGLCHTGWSGGYTPRPIYWYREEISMGTGCAMCHNRPLDNGDGVPPGGRRAVLPGGSNPHDFGNTSHHVRGAVQTADCLVCHDLSRHQQGHVRLKDPDNHAIIYVYDQATPDEMETFCLNCHDTDGVSAGPGTLPFSDGVIVPNVKGPAGSLWAASAHKVDGQRCNDCHVDNAHGSSNIKLLQVPRVDTLCFNCHTQDSVRNDALSNNRPGGYVSADDIQEAFAKSRHHDLETAAFTIGSGTFTLQCTSCHNPHVATGQYWEAESGVSPVTRPDFSDPLHNPRAMGDTLWGTVPGEKMANFAALGTGTGGWYYSTARGGVMIWDRPAVYQPPKSGDGYAFEFAGDVLPDYTTLCLDCHSHRVNEAIPPVNWGQGIACTDNAVDPPDQRVECGAQHGLNPAGRPWYLSDEGTAGFWGSNGNPDVLFHMNYVTRGRGNGHFMRWPYDSAERSAGINFVMACTDCHEAHGSNRAGMIRERFNVNANGDCGTGGDTSPNGENCSDGGNWNTFCNACHYYYGGQHQEMSCGNASCHEANSIHRIIHAVGSGAGTQLRLTACGYEASYVRPDFTPDIVTAEGRMGSPELVVTFRDDVWANMDLSGALEARDFWLFDINGDNPRRITGVTHTAGEATAILTVSAPLSAVDLFSDILATTGQSVWNWYAGGYENWATGVIPAQAVSAGPWPVRITLGATGFSLNESAGGATVADVSGHLVGIVNNASETLVGDGYFHGDGVDNYIDFDCSSCLEALKATTALTLEVRIRPSGMEGTANYIKRVLARDSGGNYQLSVWRNNSWDSYEAPDGVASMAFWVSPLDKHGGAWWKPVLTDYDACPIVSDHWYQVKVVWNSEKTDGVPGDIFVDDQGPNGDDVAENWSGYGNCTDSDQSLLTMDRYLYEGDEITPADGDFTVGTNVNDHANNVFIGLIDWIAWQHGVDYSGVDDPPIPP